MVVTDDLTRRHCHHRRPRRDEQLVIGLELGEAVVNLLRHAVVVGVRQARQIVCCPLGDEGDACY